MNHLKKFNDYTSEKIVIPVEVGDTVYMGKFKNKKTVIKEIGEDETGMPTINKKKAVTFRIEPPKVNKNWKGRNRWKKKKKVFENFTEANDVLELFISAYESDDLTWGKLVNGSYCISTTYNVKLNYDLSDENLISNNLSEKFGIYCYFSIMFDDDIEEEFICITVDNKEEMYKILNYIRENSNKL